MLSVMMSLMAASLYSPAVVPRPQPPIISMPAPPFGTAVPATRAQGSLPGLFTTDDYPAEALRNQETGTVSFAIAIDREGRVTNCSITNSSGSASLDRTTCDVVQRRARFRPARDVRGRTVEDRSEGRITWELPRETVEDDHAASIVTINRGAIGTCRNEPASLGRGACNFAQRIVKQLLSYSDVPPASEVVVEFGDRIGTAPGLATVGIGPGLQRVALVAVTMTIAADGSITDCRPAAGLVGNRANATNCPRPHGREFEPQPPGVSAPRQLTNYQLVYLRGVTTPPTLDNLAGMFSPDDYPADALTRSREGRVAAAVTVEADGRASGCAIRSSSGTPSLDAVTCAKLLSAGRYAAARDAQQRPVRGTLVRRIAWQLPRAPIDDRSTRLVFTLSGGESCVVEGTPNGDIDCDGARDFVSTARVSADAKGKSALVAEFGQVIGTGESIERIDRGPGKSAWYMSAVTLLVDAAGTLVECKPSFDWVGADDAKEQCDSAHEDLFAPLEAGVANRQPRALTRYETIYFRN